MNEEYKESLIRAVEKRIGSIDRSMFSAVGARILDTAITVVLREQLASELAREPYASSFSQTFERLKNFKLDITASDDLLARESEDARRELARVIDNFIGDVIEALEFKVNRSRGEASGRR
jgi:hypothetical protein